MPDFYWITDPKKLKKFRMAFSAVDKHDTGIISFRELATVLKHIGEPVAEMELKKMAIQCDMDREDDIHYDEFLYMIATLCPEDDDRDEIIDALKVFDNGKGYIKEEDIRVVMGNLGDRMSKDEIEDMLTEVTIKNGLIKINEFATILCR